MMRFQSIAFFVSEFLTECVTKLIGNENCGLAHKRKNLMPHKLDRLSKTAFVVQKRNLVDEQNRPVKDTRIHSSTVIPQIL